MPIITITNLRNNEVIVTDLDKSFVILNLKPLEVRPVRLTGTQLENMGPTLRRFVGLAWISYTVASDPAVPDNVEFLPGSFSGSGGAGSTIIDGQDTSALAEGEIGFVAGTNIWVKAKCDGTEAQASAMGIGTATAGEVLPPSQKATVKFTTAGGAPVPGDDVFLAAAASDGNTAAGKASAIPPPPGTFQTVVGVCLDASLYASQKKAVIVFLPEDPTELGG